MKKAAWIGAVVLALAGCSGSDIEGGQQALDAEASVNADENFTEASPSETVSSEAGPSTSPRGFIPKQIGEEAGVYVDEERTKIGYTFTVDEIIPDFQCDETPENGGFLAVRLTVTTTPDYEDGSFYISQGDFKVISPEGMQQSNTATFSAYQCVPDNEVFPMGGPEKAVTAKGMFVLDTAVPTGILVLEPFGTTGWEWQF